MAERSQYLRPLPTQSIGVQNTYQFTSAIAEPYQVGKLYYEVSES